MDTTKVTEMAKEYTCRIIPLLYNPCLLKPVSKQFEFGTFFRWFNPLKFLYDLNSRPSVFYHSTTSLQKLAIWFYTTLPRHYKSFVVYHTCSQRRVLVMKKVDSNIITVKFYITGHYQSQQTQDRVFSARKCEPASWYRKADGRLCCL